MNLLDLFKSSPQKQDQDRSDSETIRKISLAIDKLPQEQAKYIAAFAFILGRVANVDLHISLEEINEMEQIVERIGELPKELATLVVQIAKSQHVMFGSTESYVVTQEFNRQASRPQKLALLHCLFAVSCSDQAISVKEDNEIRSISRELRLDHAEFIAARSNFRGFLNVLK